MSLDVYLHAANPQVRPAESRIFVRDSGQTREVSREEWDRLHPGRAPVIFEDEEAETTEVYSANITHNLNTMASEAGIYKHLWRPDEIGVTKAAQLIEPLTAGLALLQADPFRFEAFNPKNGWGTYEGLVSFVERYLAACRENPDAEVSVSR